MKYLLVVLIFIPLVVFSQKSKRLQPGKMYSAGDTLYAPRLGFKSVVPAGFQGVLPRDTEVFLLNAETSSAEIFVFGREKSKLEDVKRDWEAGVKMDESFTLKAKGIIEQTDNLSSEVVVAGPSIDKSKRGYATAKCSGNGTCVVCLAIIPAADYDKIKKSLDSFLSASKFEAPSLASPYADFNWKEFLSGQMLVTYIFVEKGSKETTIHLCADGSFSSNVSKKGILKNQNPVYKGKLKGSWTVAGIGEKGQLHLTFPKGLPPLDVELLIKDEKIYAGGERYFAAKSDSCK